MNPSHSRLISFAIDFAKRTPGPPIVWALTALVAAAMACVLVWTILAGVDC